MSNSWVNHVKQFSKDHNINYAQALKHPNIKETYGGSIKSEMVRKIIYAKNFDPVKVHNPSNFIQDLSKTKKSKKVKLAKVPEIDQNLINDLQKLKPIKLKQPKQLIKIDEMQKNNDQYFLSDYLDCSDKGLNDRNYSTSQRNILNKMFDQLNTLFPTENTKKLLEDIETTNTYSYVMDWINKKENAKHSAEYSDFVKLVVYPSLKKENSNKDTLLLMLKAHDIAVEFIQVFKRNISPYNRCRVIDSFIRHYKKYPEVLNSLKKADKNIDLMIKDYSYFALGVEDLQKASFKDKLHFNYD